MAASATASGTLLWNALGASGSRHGQVPCTATAASTRFAIAWAGQPRRMFRNGKHFGYPPSQDNGQVVSGGSSRRQSARSDGCATSPSRGGTSPGPESRLPAEQRRIGKHFGMVGTTETARSETFNMDVLVGSNQMVPGKGALELQFPVPIGRALKLRALMLDQFPGRLSCCTLWRTLDKIAGRWSRFLCLASQESTEAGAL